MAVVRAVDTLASPGERGTVSFFQCVVPASKLGLAIMLTRCGYIQTCCVRAGSNGGVPLGMTISPSPPLISPATGTLHEHSQRLFVGPDVDSVR